jgi:two-component system cell cycle sensor histidine kinase/response regulator CckA
MTGPEPARILILEGRSSSGERLAARVEALGHTVAGDYGSGEEGLQVVETARPDLVLLDIDLDGALDGVETARVLRARGTTALVYVTAHSDLETAARVRETQPLGYLLKPFDPDELRMTLDLAIIRQRDEQDRLRREQSYYEAFQGLADGVIATDLAGVIHFVNPAAEKLTGWQGEEAVGRSLHEVFRIFGGDGQPAQVEIHGQGESEAERIVWLTDRQGRRVPIQDRTGAMRDRNNSLTGVIVLFRKAPAAGVDGGAATVAEPLAPQAGAAAALPLVDVVESISDPMIAVDGNWRMVFVNASASRLFERATQQLLGADFWGLLPEAARQTQYGALARSMLHRQTVTCDLFLEHRGSWLEVRGYPFGEGLLLLIQDITGRREEEERRSRMDRLESLGLLARGFAHDFNNLLTVLLGNLSLAEVKMRNNPALPELQTAKQATLQAQNLVQQLLTFARGGAPIKRPTRLADLLESFFEHHPRQQGISYQHVAQQDLPEVAVDPAQIRRVLANLVRNAEQAQPGGGSVIARVYVPDLRELFPAEKFDEDEMPGGGSRVVIEVRDQGEGITPENLSRVFEPYYSTRKSANATGLGLTVCESIAKAHNGSIIVRSAPGHGTTVRFYLPVDADGEDLDEFGMARDTAEEQAAAPRVLLLEDDPLVRSLIIRNLSGQGYDVVGSVEGGETVRLYQEARSEGRPFDLVILDLSIPNGMGGVRTMEKLRSLDPEVVAIVSSGYSDDPVMAKPAAYGFTGVLPKPYEPADMLRLVRNVLAARGVRGGAEKQ